MSSIRNLKANRSYDDLDNRIRANFSRYKTNKDLAIFLNVNISIIRSRCYLLGLKKMELEYFTPEQVQYLIKQYPTKGDVELAEVFQNKWPKKKGWTKKHIEKKRKYLGLFRTKKQIRAIHDRNVKAGRFKICSVKAWNKRGRIPEGAIRYWSNPDTGKKYPVIKQNGKFRHWGRWAWEKFFGKIPCKSNVVFKDGNPFNLSIQNLELLSNQELAKRNAGGSSQRLSDNYIAGILSHHDPELRKRIKSDKSLLELKRKQLTLKRIIYEQEND